jgi:hypothetical protein
MLLALERVHWAASVHVEDACYSLAGCAATEPGSFTTVPTMRLVLMLLSAVQVCDLHVQSCLMAMLICAFHACPLLVKAQSNIPPKTDCAGQLQLPYSFAV